DTVLDSKRVVVFVLGLQYATNRTFELAGLERFVEVIRGTKLDGLDHFAGVVGTRHHQDLLLRAKFLAPFQGLQSIHPRHHEIEQHQVRSRPALHSLHSFLATSGGFYMIVLDLKKGPGITKYARLVIDEKNAWRAHCFFPFLMRLRQ